MKNNSPKKSKQQEKNNPETELNSGNKTVLGNENTVVDSMPADPNSVDLDKSDAMLPDDCVRVSLTRGPHGYGFSIIGGIDQPYLANDSGIFITRISRKGTAAVSGTLAIGDKIISINGESTDGLLHSSVLELFHVANKQVDLVVWPHAESLLRQDLLARQEQLAKSKVTVKGALWFMTKSSVIAGAIYYFLKKFEVIDKRGALLVPVKEAPKKIFSELLAFCLKPFKSLKSTV